MARSVLVTSAFVSLVMLFSRLTGFLRELLLASQLGTGQHADAAILMLTFPDFMVGFLLAGGLSAAIIPALKQRDQAERLRLIRRIILQTMLFFALLAVGLAWGAQYVIAGLAPSLGQNPLEGYETAFRISMFALPMIAVVGALTSYLNTVGRFILPSLSVLMFNLIICFYLAFFLSPAEGFGALALVLIVATLARVILQVSFSKEILGKANGQSRPIGDLGLARKFIFGVVSYGIIVGAPIVFRAVYALNGDGYLAVFSFSKKLYDLPTALLVAPLIAILLPKLAALAQLGQEGVQDHLIQAMTVCLAFVSIAMVSGWLFMPMIVELVFLRGAMTAADAAHITELTRLFLLALPFYAMMHLGAIGLSAQGQVNRVFIIALVSLVLSFALTYTLHNNGFDLSAIYGFIAFYVIAAGMSLAVVLRRRLLIWETWRNVVFVGLKTGAVAVPFIAIQASSYAAQPFWPEFGLFLICGLALSAVHFNTFRLLYKMRVDTT